MTPLYLDEHLLVLDKPAGLLAVPGRGPDKQDCLSTRAQALWQRKFGQPPATPQERARQTRFLLSRGFSGEVVRRVLSQAGAAADDDEAV